MRLAARDSSITLNSVECYYRDWGQLSASPILLLHGFGEQTRSYDTLASSLADRWRVLGLDMRGHGASGRADDYRWEAFVDDIVAFVDTLRLAPITIVGHSMGATFGYLYAARHPETMTRLVLIDQAPGAELQPETMQKLGPLIKRNTFKGPEELIEQMQKILPRYRESELIRTAFHQLERRPDGRWRWRFDPKLLSPESGLTTPDVEELLADLRRVQCPTLLIRGADSENLSRDVAERAVAALPNGTLVDVPEAGHYVPWENPEGLSAAVRAFLES